jgi:hypothetical protein
MGEAIRKNRKELPQIADSSTKVKISLFVRLLFRLNLSIAAWVNGQINQDKLSVYQR